MLSTQLLIICTCLVILRLLDMGMQNDSTNVDKSLYKVILMSL